MLVPIIVLVSNELHWRPRTYLVAQTVTHLAIAVCVDRCVRIGPGGIHRVLNAAPFRFVGAISYCYASRIDSGGSVGSRPRRPTPSTATISTVIGLPVAADRA